MKCSKISLRSSFLVVTLAALTAWPASAYRMIQANSNGRVTAGNAVLCNAAGGFAHWTTLQVDWRLNSANQGNGGVTPLRNAVETWNKVTPAGYVIRYAGATNSGWATDGTNSVLWATGNGCTGNCLALTALVIQNGQEIIESDITFNNSRTWTSNGNQFDRETVLLHELGHSLGIHHSEVGSPRPIMAQTYLASHRNLTNDDKAALNCSYDRYHPCTAAPATPQYITGPSHDLCVGTEEVYQTPHVPGAESYRWEVLNSFFARNTSNNDVLLSGWYLQPPGSYVLRVRAQNSCGSSAWRQAGIFVLPNTDPQCGGCSGRFCL